MNNSNIYWIGWILQLEFCILNAFTTWKTTSNIDRGQDLNSLVTKLELDLVIIGSNSSFVTKILHEGLYFL